MKYKGEEVTEQKLEWIITDRKKNLITLNEEIRKNVKLVNQLSLRDRVIGFLLALVIVLSVLLLK